MRNAKTKVRVLCIDDESNVLSALKRLFHKSEIEMVCTTNPKEFLEKITKTEFAVLISDQRMPEMEGTEILRRARVVSPKSVRIILTGYADIQAAISAVNDGNVFRFLTKPWNEEQLRAALAEAVAYYNLVAENAALTDLTQRQNEELKSWNKNLEWRVEERTMEIQALHGELKKSFLESIKTMGSLSGIFDERQEGHSSRVARMAGAIAKAKGMNPRDCFEVQVASFLHDVGTIAIRYHVNSPITAKAEAVKISARVASLIPGLGKAPIYVLHQAEQFNGLGYPEKLDADNIPLGARMIAAANAFDELLQDEGKQDAASVRNALENLKQKAGLELDPEIVNILIEQAEKNLEKDKDQEEIQKEIFELRENMILSRALILKNGEKLLDAGVKLTQEVLELLWKRQLSEQSIDTLYIYSNSLPKIAKQDRMRRAS